LWCMGYGKLKAREEGGATYRAPRNGFRGIRTPGALLRRYDEMRRAWAEAGEGYLTQLRFESEWGELSYYGSLGPEWGPAVGRVRATMMADLQDAVDAGRAHPRLAAMVLGHRESYAPVSPRAEAAPQLTLGDLRGVVASLGGPDGVRAALAAAAPARVVEAEAVEAAAPEESSGAEGRDG